MEINELLRIMVDKKASDLLLRVPSHPVLRIDGKLIAQKELPQSDSKDIEMAFERIANPTQRSTFLKEKQLDFAYSVSGLARFRVNVIRQRGTISIAFRMVPFDILSIEELELPTTIKNLLNKPQGLILITGLAGSGKSTTMAAMVNHINQNEERNIITIEDTIEYLHSNNRSIIAQRDLQDDVASFATALKHAERHIPDIIVIGEMRKQKQIRMQLSRVLEAVLSQKLVTRINGGRVAAFEIMTIDTKMREMIRESKYVQFGNNGSIKRIDQELAELVNKGVISPDEALNKCNDLEMMQNILEIKLQKTK
jgi:twitching motility protein PilT